MSNGEEREVQAPEAPEVTSTDLLDEIADATGMTSATEGYAKARQGIGELIKILVREKRTDERVQSGLIDTLVAEIDERIPPR